MTYKSYPDRVNTPSRMNRKKLRNQVFQHNKSLRGKLNREKRDARLNNG